MTLTGDLPGLVSAVLVPEDAVNLRAPDATVTILRRRRKSRGDADEAFARAMLTAADRLRAWARTVHKRPSLREADEGELRT